MQVRQARGTRVAKGTHDVSLTQQRPRGHALANGIEVPKQHEVVSEATLFPDDVVREHGCSKERPGIENPGLALLVLQRHELHGRTNLAGNVRPAVPHMREAAAPPLVLVGLVEIVTTDDEVPTGEAGRYGVSVGVVVRRALGQLGDLLVDGQAAAAIVVRTRRRMQRRAALGVLGDFYAHVTIGQ